MRIGSLSGMPRLKSAGRGVGTRLALGYGCVLILMCAVAGQGVWRTQLVTSAAVTVLEERIPRLTLLHDTVTSINKLGLDARDTLLDTEQSKIDSGLARIEKGREEIGKQIETLSAALVAENTDEARLLAETFGQHSSGVLIGLVKFGRTVKGGDKPAAAGVLRNLLEPKLQALADFSAQFLVQEMAQFAKSKEQIISAKEASFVQTALLLGLALLLGVGTAVYITRSITRPLNRAVNVADQVATGDLTREIEVTGHDELSKLLTALQRMQSSLTSIVGKVLRGCEAVASASAEIAQGNVNLSDRTEQQAMSLEKTAVAMEEFGQTVHQNAGNAHKAHQLAQEASEIAQQGSSVVGKTVETMMGINESSRRIADIIAVMDTIAFQINILALNAAVEAARAGEHGRGFAVVAAEVRNLAQSSANAAKEIKGLINDSVDRVKAGTKLVDQAGHTMQEIVASILRVSSIVGEISHVCEEQTVGITQVGEAITLMDGSTQQNAALVEESAAAAESMRQQARELVQAVSVFRLSQGGSDYRGAVDPIEQNWQNNADEQYVDADDEWQPAVAVS